jgi:hypothetical protein
MGDVTNGDGVFAVTLISLRRYDRLSIALDQPPKARRTDLQNSVVGLSKIYFSTSSPALLVR